MSLKRFLENEDIMAKFRVELKKPRISYSKLCVAEPKTKNYAIVGIAFDYLLRIYIYRLNRDLCDNLRFIAEEAIDKNKLGTKLYSKAKKLHKTINKYVSEFLESGEVTDGLLASCLILAQFELVIRANVIDEYFGEYDIRDVEDLRKLITVAMNHSWKCESRCLLNPNFGLSSLLVGGADADLILDDMIIDIKAVKKPGVVRQHFDQIFGYLLLSRLEGMNGIKKVGIYSARFGELIVYSIDDIIGASELDEMTEWFKERGLEDYGAIYEMAKARMDLESL